MLVGLINYIDQSFSREDIKKLYQEKFPKYVVMCVNQNSRQILRFVNNLQIGEIITKPYNTS